MEYLPTYVWIGGTILILIMVVFVMCLMVVSRRAEDEAIRMERRMGLFSDDDHPLGGV